MDSAKLTQTLTERRVEIEEQMKSLVEGSAVPTEDGIEFQGRVGDGRSEAVDRMTDENLYGGLLSELETVDSALAKLDAGTYGNCEHCGNAIDDNRLAALPWAISCMNCS